MILVVSTAAPLCRLSIISDNGQERIFDWEAGRELARDMHAHILMALDGDLQSISAIVAHRGPGSFTGLRIGITVLNTLADSLGVPIIGEVGDGWRERALERLRSGQDDQIVMPEYGAEAHITQQKK